MRAPDLFLVLCLSPLGFACGGGSDLTLAGESEEEQIEVELAARAPLPARGTATSFDVGAWNVEWFGSTVEGPTNEVMQQANVRQLLRDLDMDLWGLEEIVSRTRFEQLVAAMPGYAGLLANDPVVTDGARYYSTAEQKVALVYKTAQVKVLSAKLILTASSSDFGGRPPMEVSLELNVGGLTRTLIVIVAHFKAKVDFTSYQQRVRSAAALKAYLDQAYPTRWVLVIGDFNDDIDVSTSSGRESPFRAFADDAARYKFLTAPLTAAGTRTYLGGPHTIDHHLATNELARRLVPGSVEAFQAQTFITGYRDNTSDHLPVLSRHDLR